MEGVSEAMERPFCDSESREECLVLTEGLMCTEGVACGPYEPSTA